jgi:transketolase
VREPDDELHVIAVGMRAFCLAANKHPGGSLSCVEALTALYFGGAAALRAGAGRSDHVVYSKGHAAAPYYFALWAHGFFPGVSLSDLAGFGQAGHPIPRMPTRSPGNGVAMSTGALGQGLSFACGMAAALRRAGRDSRVFAVLGDGECTEGQVWEAALSASRHGLRNVVALVDANGSGSVIRLDRESWARRWESFGWSAREVDGHDLGAVCAALEDTRESAVPSVIVLRTVKGKGLLPPAEGSNSLSGEVDGKYIPATDLDLAVSRALDAVDQRFPGAAARRAGAAAVTDARDLSREAALPDERPLIARLLRGDPAGVVASVKQVGGSLADDLAACPVVMLSPDAIRNSGLLPRMLRAGPWSYENAASNVMECPIAEQDAASMAAGMAACGLRPVLFSMEGFYWRMLDQVRESICFSQLPVLLVGTSGGIGDPLGPMVQSDTCLLALCALNGLDIYEAADANWARLLAAEALAAGVPAYLRLPHEPVTVRDDLEAIRQLDLSDGAWVIRDHPEPEVTVVTAGAMRQTALAAAGRLASECGSGVRVVEVFGISRLRSLPQERMSVLVPRGTLAVSIHNAPARVLGDALPAGAVIIGSDGYGQGGWPLQRLYENAGLTADAVVRRAREALSARETA